MSFMIENGMALVYNLSPDGTVNNSNNHLINDATTNYIAWVTMNYEDINYNMRVTN